MTAELKSRRVPWVALVLSFLAPGVGHLYCGRIIKAIPLYLSWTVVLLCATIAALLQPSLMTLVALLLLPAGVMFIVYLYAALDAWRHAHQIGSDYSLRDCNRGMIYLLLILVHNIYPIGLIAGVRGLVYEPFVIPVSSMSPTILNGDRILARKLHTKQSPERGDLVVYRNPIPKGGTRFIGRVVAIAGDQLEISDERLLINGTELERDRVASGSMKSLGTKLNGTVSYEENTGRRYFVMYRDGPVAKGGAGGSNAKTYFQTTIPAGRVFVLGDNRDRSRDSRQFGAIATGDIVGYIDYIYWPSATWTRLGLVDQLP